MSHTSHTANPFYAGRCKRITPAPRPEPEPCRRPERPVYAKLPRAPINASPVPHLPACTISTGQASMATANGRATAAAI